MGSVRHPNAELARESASNRDFVRAAIQLDSALKEEPAHPDLACEAAILAIYRAREEEAFELLPICEEGLRFGKLISLLADHYTSRILFDRTDHDARRRLQLLRTFKPKESIHLGIKISACLIVKNEEKLLERCLSSLQGKVDQIVVVDTGSTDSTVEIARRYDAKLGEFEWCDDFSAARNHALSLASGHWILWIDADEELAEDCLPALHRAVVRPQFGGFDIEIINYLDEGTGGEQFRHCPTRLFRRLPEIQFLGRIHEQINPSLAKLGLPWTRLDGAVIFHHGYRPGVMDEKSKLQRTITLLENEVQEDPSNGFQWFNLANAYIVGNRPADALKCAKFATLLTTSDGGFAVPSYSVLIQSLHLLGRYDEAVDAADEAVSKGFDALQIAFEKSTALIGAGRFEQALDHSKHMMSLGWVKGSAGDIGIYTHKRFVLCAQIYMSLRRAEEALKFIDTAVAAAPDYAPAHFVRAQVLERLHREDEALYAYQLATRDPACALVSKRNTVRLLLAQSRFEEACNLSHEIWRLNVSDAPSWRDWYHCCQASGNLSQVLNCFKEFSEYCPPTAEFMVDWGRAWAAAGDNQAAIKCFAEGMKLDPSYSNAYFNCGDVMYGMGMSNQAAELYRAGLSQAPNYAEGWFVLGNALTKAGRHLEAKQAYETTLQKSPNHDRARHNLDLLGSA